MGPVHAVLSSVKYNGDNFSAQLWSTFVKWSLSLRYWQSSSVLNHPSGHYWAVYAVQCNVAIVLWCYSAMSL